MSSLSILNRRDRRDLAQQLIEVGCYQQGSFTLKNKTISNVYIDLRQISSHVHLLYTIMWHLKKFHDSLLGNSSASAHRLSVAGVPYSGIPFASILAYERKVPLILIRKEAKDHGSQEQIEGPKDRPLLLIEDVMTTGSSILETVTTLRQNGYTVSDVVVLVDRSSPETRINIPEVTLHSLLTLNDFSLTTQLKELRQKSRIVLAWDPSLSSFLALERELGPHIAALKVHSDTFERGWLHQWEKVIEASKHHGFMIIDDRKLADTGSTTALQLAALPFGVDIVTVHALPGIDFDIYRKAKISVLLIAEMSTSPNLFTEAYTQEVVAMAKANPDIVVGIVAQHQLDDTLLHFVPGVHRSISQDESNQSWRTPDQLQDMDFWIVGRDISEAEYPGEVLEWYTTQH